VRGLSFAPFLFFPGGGFAVRFYTVKGILELPAFLTVEEAARILRLKRSTAYEYVRRRGDSFSPP